MLVYLSLSGPKTLFPCGHQSSMVDACGDCQFAQVVLRECSAFAERTDDPCIRLADAQMLARFTADAVLLAKVDVALLCRYCGDHAQADCDLHWVKCEQCERQMVHHAGQWCAKCEHDDRRQSHDQVREDLDGYDRMSVDVAADINRGR